MTTQVREILRMNEEDLAMESFPELPPAEYLLERDDWPPEEFDPNNPDILTVGTWCWRGYKGHWEIIGSKLFLKNIRGKYILKEEGPLFAFWVTQNLVFEMITEPGKLLELVVVEGNVKGIQLYSKCGPESEKECFLKRALRFLFGP